MSQSNNSRRGLPLIALVVALIAIIVGGIALQSAQANTSQLQDQVKTLQNQVSTLQSQANSFQNQMSNVTGKLSSLQSVNQKPAVRSVLVEWAEVQSQQDRFLPSFITVNQGDTVDITLISNDTEDAHTFTLVSPGQYNFRINATVPGLVNALNDQTFTTAATGNSPGVTISGTVGNVTAKGSFVAKFAGVYEYICIYHVAFGMYGYLVVLPNQAYTGS